MALARRLVELVSPYNHLWTPDYPLDLSAANMPVDLRQDTTDVLQQGEWFKLDAEDKASRAVTASLAVSGGGKITGGISSSPCWMTWNERGMFDTIIPGKFPLIKGGWFEANTKMYLYSDNSPLLGGDNIVTGTPLVVTKGAAESGGYDKFALLAGLANPTSLDTGVKAYVVGVCTKSALDNKTNNITKGIRFYSSGFGTVWVGA